MTRRDLALSLAAGTAAALAKSAEPETLVPPPGYSIMDMGGLKHFWPNKPEQIAMLIYPGMTALDLIGPQQAFGYTMGAKVNLIWKTLEPITTDTGVKITPSATLHNTTEQVDLIFVPGGGKGAIDLMSDTEILGFLARQGKGARYVTSVCSGSLVLGAAGLLRGYRATSHWAVRDVLPTLGAQLAPGRVVEDRNRITAGGVTAGIDFGLYLAGKLRGEDYGRALELMLEYDPHPPFHSGTPAEATANVRDLATRMYAPLLKSAQASAESARARFASQL
jgi:cyclohexyl-isocyanide hydratase